ncbi:adenosylhomocysteinase [Rhizobium sp. B230/85]|nr:adenosylhomocysteinase [Rhizobium sp. B209b/85]QXZ98611.1 adenosylhomocysteinase [Rhizobium sp. B230/85]
MTIHDETGQIDMANVRRARATTEMPVLAAISKNYRTEIPFTGERIALCGHITEATAVQVDTLRRLGAEVAWCASSTSTTDEGIRLAVIADGVFVTGRKGMSTQELDAGVRMVRDYWPSGPTLILDEGARLIRDFHLPGCQTPLPRLAAEKTPEGISAIAGTPLRVCSRKRVSSEPFCHELDHCCLDEG